MKTFGQNNEIVFQLNFSNNSTLHCNIVMCNANRLLSKNHTDDHVVLIFIAHKRNGISSLNLQRKLSIVLVNINIGNKTFEFKNGPKLSKSKKNQRRRVTHCPNHVTPFPVCPIYLLVITPVIVGTDGINDCVFAGGVNIFSHIYHFR